MQKIPDDRGRDSDSFLDHHDRPRRVKDKKEKNPAALTQKWRRSSSYRQEVLISWIARRGETLQFTFRQAVWFPLGWKSYTHVLPSYDEATDRIVFQENRRRGYVLDPSGYCLRLRHVAFPSLVPHLMRFTRAYTIPLTLSLSDKPPTASFSLKALREGLYDTSNHFQSAPGEEISMLSIPRPFSKPLSQIGIL